jgi:hypothetical protein
MMQCPVHTAVGCQCCRFAPHNSQTAVDSPTDDGSNLTCDENDNWHTAAIASTFGHIQVNSLARLQEQYTALISLSY